MRPKLYLYLVLVIFGLKKVDLFKNELPYQSEASKLHKMLKNFRKFCKQNSSWLGSGSARKSDGSARLDQVLARARLGSKKI